MSQVLLSIVIPAYNEESRLGASLKKIISYLDKQGRRFEIIVVDDGSSDRTVQTVKETAEKLDRATFVQILENGTNQGKGYSVRRGMLAASGECALLTDADLSTPIDQIIKLELEVIQKECHIAFGSRDLQDSEIYKHQSLFRETGGKIFNLVMRLVTGLPYRDTQCGFKLFNMQFCRALFKQQRLTNYAYDVEILYLARTRGLSVREIGVGWQHHPNSKIHILSDGIGLFWGLFTIRWNDFLGRYAETGNNAEK